MCEQNLPLRNLVIQNNVEALVELVSSSSMPVFSSQRLVDRETPPPVVSPSRSWMNLPALFSI